jgi:hypothetical protein
MGACNRVYNSNPTEHMLAATLQAFLGIFPNHGPPALYCEGHGRATARTLDVSRTVGWFTTLAPIRIPTGLDE